MTAAEVADAHEAELVRDQVVLMSAVQEALEEGTPVRTGYHRAAWQPYGGAEPSPDEPPRSATTAGGRAEVEAAMAGWRLGDPAGHVNDAPAAQRLAAGSSRQARQGWTETAIRRAVDSVRSSD